MISEKQKRFARRVNLSRDGAEPCDGKSVQQGVKFVLCLLAESLERIAKDRPDLMERYDKAISYRDAREIERIWFQCNKILYTPLRINGITSPYRT